MAYNNAPPRFNPNQLVGNPQQQLQLQREGGEQASQAISSGVQVSRPGSSNQSHQTVPTSLYQHAQHYHPQPQPQQHRESGDLPLRSRQPNGLPPIGAAIAESLQRNFNPSNPRIFTLPDGTILNEYGDWILPPSGALFNTPITPDLAQDLEDLVPAVINQKRLSQIEGPYYDPSMAPRPKRMRLNPNYCHPDDIDRAVAEDLRRKKYRQNLRNGMRPEMARLSAAQRERRPVRCTNVDAANKRWATIIDGTSGGDDEHDTEDDDEPSDAPEQRASQRPNGIERQVHGEPSSNSGEYSRKASKSKKEDSQLKAERRPPIWVRSLPLE